MRPHPLVLLLWTACRAENSFDAATSRASGGTSTSPTPPPPVGPGEDEEELLRLPPAQTDVYVFVANPERDTVTRVEVRTLSVVTTPVGRDPRIVATTSDRRQAVVFNRGDASVSVLDADSLAQEVVDVRANLNDLVLSPDGAWAVVWRNNDRVRPDDPPIDGIQSFNEASFVRLADASHQPLAVGFDPQMVRFTPDGSLAVIVSDSALALVDLTQETLSAEVTELQPGVLTPAGAEEVVVAPDGSYAWVRLRGSPELRVVDLVDRSVTSVAAGREPTDLDLSPDGLTTVSVSRGTNELFVFDTIRPLDAPRIVTLPVDGTWGSLQFAPTGDTGVVFSNAVAQERYVLWEPDSDVVVERALVKPVQSVGVSPDGGTLLVFHTRGDGPLTNPLFAGEEAMTLIDLDDGRTNPLLLPSAPLSFTHSASGALGYLVTEGKNYLQVLDYTTLLPEQVTLPSPPVFLGVLPDLAPGDADEPSAWVSQEYSLGRLTFWDPDERVADTLTGFELNAGIVVSP